MNEQLIWQAAAAREFDRLPDPLRDRIYTALARLVFAGEGDVRPVKTQPGVYRLRVGDYRILFEDTGDAYEIVRVSRRDHAY